MVTSEQLAKLKIGVEWTDAINETFSRFNIINPFQRAAFIGQCGHECGNFKTLEENLNYRAATLIKLWPKRFPTQDIANEYAGKPQKIANKVYASRMGNRDEASGDGYRFRGRGCLQITGSDNYHFAGKALAVDFWASPDLVATPKYAALTAGWFWATHRCNILAEERNWTALTKVINGGTFGLQERIKQTEEAFAVLMG
jgi:putative chitinase